MVEKTCEHCRKLFKPRQGGQNHCCRVCYMATFRQRPDQKAKVIDRVKRWKRDNPGWWKRLTVLERSRRQKLAQKCRGLTGPAREIAHAMFCWRSSQISKRCRWVEFPKARKNATGSVPRHD